MKATETKTLSNYRNLCPCVMVPFLKIHNNMYAAVPTPSFESPSYDDDDSTHSGLPSNDIRFTHHDRPVQPASTDNGACQRRLTSARSLIGKKEPYFTFHFIHQASAPSYKRTERQMQRDRGAVEDQIIVRRIYEYIVALV